MGKLLDKLMSTNTIKGTALLSKSTLYNAKDMITTSVPVLNIALSGSMYGGLTPGLTVIAGPSKHFKSLMALIMAKAYLDKYPDAILVFYDNEFGSPKGYFKAMGIAEDRVLTKPLEDIEQLKFDIMPMLQGIEKGDKIIIIIDSIGNIASKKEVDDAVSGNAAADMSRAKQLKSLFRMCTPHLTTKDIPMVCINHTYQELALHPRNIVSGGTGVMYSADNVWILGRQQEKDSKNKITGYNFVINIEKSRFVKEKAKINLMVSHESGIDLYSGLKEIAIDGKFMGQPIKGKYQLLQDGEFVGESVKENKIGTLLDQIKDLPEFDEHCQKMYKLGQGAIIGSASEVDDDEEDDE